MYKLYFINILLIKRILNKICRQIKDKEKIFIFMYLYYLYFIAHIAEKRLVSSIKSTNNLMEKKKIKIEQKHHKNIRMISTSLQKY